MSLVMERQYCTIIRLWYLCILEAQEAFEAETGSYSLALEGNI